MASPALPWPAITDDLGPAKVVLIRDPTAALDAVVVVDNTACGPAIGGVRMATDVTLEEVARLARAMTLKNAAAGLAHGGGKAGIVAEPRMPAAEKIHLVRSFGRAIRDLVEYIPGPDMGTNEACMGHLYDEIGRAVGLPRVLGGIPLDTIGATGFGLAIAAEVAEEVTGIRLRGHASRSRASVRWDVMRRTFSPSAALASWRPPTAAAPSRIRMGSTSPG
jgi:glutamate dehydrogenase/leucine dehydrogenase